ncbi:MAG: hypothetical protein R2739_02645 [Chitinophagales bacterium]|nr:hypothetical protein [Bacteroidota bacterium]
MENNSLPDNNPRGVLSGLAITIVSALFSTIFYVAFTLLAYYKKMPFSEAKVVFTQIISIVMSVFLALYLARKIQGNKLSLIQGILTGWMASMMLAIFISTYYTIFFKATNQFMPEGAFARLLFLYNGIGLIWSIIFAIFLRKE